MMKSANGTKAEYHKQSFTVNGVIAAILVFIVVFVPLWSVNIPPLIDYPNHLTRQYIIANISSSDYLKNFYQVKWSATPYLAMDAIVPMLARFVSVETAGKIFLTLTLLLMALAPLALSRVLHGRVTPIALLGLLFIHNSTVSLGFMSYLFSLGFALCLLSLWIRLRENRPWFRLVIFPVLSSLLFFSHLMGFVIYALTVCAYELGCHIEKVRSRIPRAPLFFDSAQRINLVSFGLQFCVPSVIFCIYGPSLEILVAVSRTTYGGIWRKLTVLAETFSHLIPPYSWTLDRILYIVLPAGLIFLLATRRLKIAKQMLWPLFAILVSFFVIPCEWLGGYGADHRLLPAIGLILAGSLCPRAGPGKSWQVAIGLIALVIAVRVTAITVEWRKADHEYAEYIRSFGSLTKGSKVYYAIGNAGHAIPRRRPKLFIPCLAVMKKEVYVPHLFTSANVPGLPLRYQPDYERLHMFRPGPFFQNGQSPNWKVFVPKYDYFYLTDERFFKDPVPKQLVPIYRGSHFVLYKNAR